MGSLSITLFEFILVLSCTISKKVSAKPGGPVLISIFGERLAMAGLVLFLVKNIPK
jgi:L-lactate permease